MVLKSMNKSITGQRFISYLIAGILLLSTQCGLANAKTVIQCYSEYLDTYSAYDGSFRKRYSHNNKPIIRLTISDAEVLSIEDYHICGNRGRPGGPTYHLFGWADSVTSSKISLFCEDIEWEPEKHSGIRTTLEIDRYTGKIMIEEFGYSINNDDMDSPFTQSELTGHCERAKTKF
jgi:hypothetical protein